jgi:hypothetical protein
MEETMKNRFLRFFQYMVLTCLAFALLCVPLSSQRAVFQAFSGEQEQIKLDVPYEPSSEEVVRAMLEIAKVDKNDLVYDLGCGDGRIVIAAAQKAGARGVGLTWIPRESGCLEKARKATVADWAVSSAGFVPDRHRPGDGGHAVSLAGSQFEVTTQTLSRAETRHSDRIP